MESEVGPSSVTVGMADQFWSPRLSTKHVGPYNNTNDNCIDKKGEERKIIATFVEEQRPPPIRRSTIMLTITSTPTSTTMADVAEETDARQFTSLSSGHQHRRRCRRDSSSSSSRPTNAVARRCPSIRLLLFAVFYVAIITSPTTTHAADTATATTTTTPARRPRGIIVFQGDDLHFDANWTPPAHLPGESALHVEMPYIEQLRTGGLQLSRAYAASPMCGTSRYSTLTGRYASRAASGRSYNRGEDISYVKILNTKLADYGDNNNNDQRRMNTDDDAGGGVADGLDCSQHNLAQVFRSNGYRTGVVGKWHLGDNVHANGNAATSTSATTDETDYDYTRVQEQIRQCGFDAAEAIYHENLSSDWTQGGAFTHNMEHLTIRAIEFIDAAVADGVDFFLYFNPTAPHESGNVYEALTTHSCRDTVEGRLSAEPVILGMTDIDGGCTAYRQSILRRADGDASNAVLGAIWTDDAVGALIRHLQSHGIWDDTLVVFQMDHGKEGKGSLYEPGVRIAQFVHYPAAIAPGTTYDGLVSTIDVAPTLLDYAGIAPAYEMDGLSWKSLLDVATTDRPRRCLVTEDDHDRAIICPCQKYLKIGDREDSGTVRRGTNFGLIHNDESAFDLCADDDLYVTSPSTSREVVGLVQPHPALVAMLECHYRMTDPNITPRYGLCDSLLLAGGSNEPPEQLVVQTPSVSSVEYPPLAAVPTAAPTTALAMAARLVQVETAAREEETSAASSYPRTCIQSFFTVVAAVVVVSIS